MIDLYTGTPGSGKSLHVAERVRIYLSMFKAPVICNFAFKAKACNPRGYGSFFYVSNNRLNPEFLIAFSERYKRAKKVKRLKEDSILLVIDEAQIIFNSRNWSKPDRLQWISFFSQHRKLGYHIILVAQYDEMLDKQIRPLIEYEHTHRKVVNMGIAGRIISLLAGGGLHVCNRIYIPTKLVLDHYFFKGSEKLYSLYDSYTRFDDTSSSGLRSGAELDV